MPGAWPLNTRICGYSSDWATLFKSEERDLDLHDAFICTLFSNLSFPFHLAVTVDDREWEILGESDDGFWDEKTIAGFETQITEDFAYDDVAVKLTRLAGEGWPRSCSAVWRLDSEDA